jgi:hypothetical protein
MDRFDILCYKTPMVMRPGAVVALLLAAASALAAQQPTERVRPGTASIAGRITEADTRRPLGGVMVTLIAQDLRARLSTETTPDGRYRFEGIAPAGPMHRRSQSSGVRARAVCRSGVQVGPHPIPVGHAPQTGIGLVSISR